MKPILGVIADDLTGGMETAAMLIGQGARCAFVTDVEEVRLLSPEASRLDAVVVALKIRLIEAKKAVAAADAAARTLLALGVRQLFYKYCATFDSTDQGNIGPIADRLAELTGAQVTLFCSSFPEAGRTVYAGHHFVDMELLSNSPKRFDPATPMTDPDLRAVLERQSRLKVGVLRYQVVCQGAAAIEEEVKRLAAKGIQHFIADAILPSDLSHLADWAVDHPLLTGSSSVAEYLPRAWKKHGWIGLAAEIGEIPPVEGPAIVLAGSCAERTLEQLDEFGKSRPVLRIDPSAGGTTGAIIANAVEWAIGRMKEGPVAVATSASPAQVADLQAQLGREEASALVEEILAGVAEGLVATGVRRLLIAGGETSGMVVQRLGLRRLKIGPYGGPGIAIAVSSGPRPLALCLKSGKLGPVDMFSRVLEQMRG